MIPLALRPRIEPSYINEDLAVRSEFNVSAIHRSGSRPLKINAFTVVTTSVTRALKFVLCRLPIRSTAKMGAAGKDDEQAIRRSINPDAILLQPFLVNS